MFYVKFDYIRINAGASIAIIFMRIFKGWFLLVLTSSLENERSKDGFSKTM